jgi:hypothetical protein
MDENVTLRPSWRTVLDSAVMVTVVGTIILAVPDAFIRGAPIDWKRLVFAIVLCAMASVSYELIQATRRSVTLTPEGVGDRVRWSQVERILADPGTREGDVWLYLATGSRSALPWPRASMWHRDARFDRDVERIHAYAVAHGAPVGPVERRSGRDKRVTLAVVLALGLAAFLVQAIRHGVVTPWQHSATAPAFACDTLLSAGLDRYWPAESRDDPKESRGSTFGVPQKVCTIYAAVQTTDSVESLSLSIVTWPGDYNISAIAQARTRYQEDGDLQPVTRLDGLGDEAFLEVHDPFTTVEARVANVTVQLSSSGRPTDGLTALLAGVVAQIR